MGHRQKAQQQQRGKEQDPRPGARFNGAAVHLQLAVGQPVYQDGQPQGAQHGQRSQHGKEVVRGEFVMVIDKQVLGIPHGGAGAAQVGGQGLEDDDAPHVQLYLFAGDQGQGHKDEKGHVVGHQHGREKGQPDERRRHVTGSAAAGEQKARRLLQHMQLPEAGHHQHEGQQHAQNGKIDIGQPGPEKKRRNQRQHQGYGQHHVPFQDASDFFSQFNCMHRSLSLSADCVFL